MTIFIEFIEFKMEKTQIKKVKQNDQIMIF